MADLLLGGRIDPATGDTHARQPTRRSSSADLTTHGVIVGMTGSGKTGLGVVLIEECLSAGVPALLIDPKGDLTNLCLIFPELRGDRLPALGQRERRPEGRRRAATSSPSSRRRRGRTASPAGASPPSASPSCAQTVEFTIYTPGLVGRDADQHRRVAAGTGRPTPTPRS